MPAAPTNAATEGRENGGSIDGDADMGYVVDVNHSQLSELHVSKVAENALHAQ